MVIDQQSMKINSNYSRFSIYSRNDTNSWRVYSKELAPYNTTRSNKWVFLQRRRNLGAVFI